MTKVIVAGAAGRMGRRIIDMVIRSEEVDLAGAFEHPDSPAVGEDAGRIAGAGEAGVTIAASLKDIIDSGDVVIDFTSPQATLENIRAISRGGLAVVIGTTGISGNILAEVRALAKGMRCVLAPNMSIGMNVMFKIAGQMAGILGDDFDIEVLEAHHRHKKDAPSGTALRLGQILAGSVNRDLDKVAVYERKGIIGERTDQEIGMQTLRAGDITGDHMVMFAGSGERLELIHRAHSRDNFAGGAVKAAAWIVKQPVGIYDMQDVLGLK